MAKMYGRNMYQQFVSAIRVVFRVTIAQALHNFAQHLQTLRFSRQRTTAANG